MSEFTTPTDKFCWKCEDTIPAEKFYKNAARLDGLSQYCKTHTKEYLESRAKKSTFSFQKKKRITKAADVKFENQPESIKKIVMYLAENPKLTCEQLAARVEISPQTVRGYMSTNDFLKAIRGVGASQITKMIPAALHAFQSSLDAKSEDVKLKAAVKLLESEKVLGPDRVDITVNDLSQKSNAELEAIIANTVIVPVQTLEAEVIS